MKELIQFTYKTTLKLVPPGCHCRNAAKVAIRNFKSHFLSILTGVVDDFPCKLWDNLLPQTKITLNLFCQSNTTPMISAYAHLNGSFNYNKMPLAPMGCHAHVHEKPTHVGPGHSIPLTDGTSIPPLTTTGCTTAISSPPTANASATLYNFATNTSPALASPPWTNSW
ncbi:hypothetical protein ACHAW6_002249 [Cyclotella cf. meneghiniana]